MNPIANSPLAAPNLLPLRSIAALKCDRSLVVAPHPDDETLGCGGAIALLRQMNCAVSVLVISDGTMSHPRSQKFPALALRDLRESETRSALSLLNVSASSIQFLRLPDGEIPMSNSPEFVEAVTRCGEILAAINPQLILLPWRFDPHPDHRATWQIIQAARQQLKLAARSIEYPIWDWDTKQRGTAGETTAIAWRLDISDVAKLKQQAIAQYRSQTTKLIDDDPQGFTLAAEMLENFRQPWEIFLEGDDYEASSF